jgi:hypothetical protein
MSFGGVSVERTASGRIGEKTDAVRSLRSGPPFVTATDPTITVPIVAPSGALHCQ